MKKVIPAFLFCFVSIQIFSQTQRKVSTYLLTQYNKTLYDYTMGNNPWGAGLGLQTIFNSETKLKSIIEFTGDVYLENYTVLRLNPDGSVPENGNDVRAAVNFFAGSSFHPSQNIYLSLVTGPSFVGEQILLGIKPSFGFYFSKDQKWMGKVSYINVFNRARIADKDFGSISVAIGRKLF